jgi:hypothetical protein
VAWRNSGLQGNPPPTALFKDCSLAGALARIAVDQSLRLPKPRSTRPRLLSSRPFRFEPGHLGTPAQLVPSSNLGDILNPQTSSPSPSRWSRFTISPPPTLLLLSLLILPSHPIERFSYESGRENGAVWCGHPDSCFAEPPGVSSGLVFPVATTSSLPLLRPFLVLCFAFRVNTTTSWACSRPFLDHLHSSSLRTKRLPVSWIAFNRKGIRY